MLPEQRRRFPPEAASLKDGRTITLRILEPADGGALAEFYATVPREDFRFYAPHALTAEEAHRAAARADLATYVCVVCTAEDGVVVGYAWYDWPGPDAEMSSFGICIRRGYQECGVGQAAMSRLLRIAAEIGPPRMALTVQTANSRAVALYRKMGFQVVRDQERAASWGFAAEPEYYMERAVR